MGYKVFTPTVLTSTDINTYLMKQTVMVFADATARSLALTAPAAGMITYLTGTNALNAYDGASWVAIGGGVTSAVAGSGISVSAATGAVTFTNTGVTSAVAGTGISVSAATGAVTFSIGQSVATGVKPTFNGVNSTGPIDITTAAHPTLGINVGLVIKESSTGYAPKINFYDKLGTTFWASISSSSVGVINMPYQVQITTANITTMNCNSAAVTTNLTAGGTLSATGNITSSAIIAANTFVYADTLRIKMGAWSASANFSAIEGNTGYLLAGNTASDVNMYLRGNTASGQVRIGGNNTDTLRVGDGVTSITGNLGTSTYITCSYLAAGATGVTDNGSVSASNWFRPIGDTGIYFQSWGGGWHMTDSTWIRGYNSKNVYAPSVLRCGYTYSGNSGRVRGSYGATSFDGNGITGGWDGIEFTSSPQTFMVLSDFYSGMYRNNNTWNWLWNYSTLQVGSDERYKRDIQPLGLGMKFIEQLEPISYLKLTEREDDDPDATEEGYYYGFTAQNVRAALDVCGETRDVKIHDIGGPNMGLVACVEGAVYDRQFIGISEFMAPVVEAIKELNVRLKTLEGV